MLLLVLLYYETYNCQQKGQINQKFEYGIIKFIFFQSK